jgi:hypothetical protein
MAAQGDVLAQIPDLADWPQAERQALAEIIRAKMSPDEALYVRLMQTHSRLRNAILELAAILFT